MELNDFRERFTQFNQVSQDSIALQKMDEDVSELERVILVFSHAEKYTSTSQLHQLHAELMTNINHLIENNSFNGSANKTLLKQMHRGVKVFYEKNRQP